MLQVYIELTAGDRKSVRGLCDGVLVTGAGCIGHRGGRTTKIPALTDADCRPIAFLLTGGHVANYTAGAPLLQPVPILDPARRHRLRGRGYPRSGQKRRDAQTSRRRPIEDGRTVSHRFFIATVTPLNATRYDRLATNLLGCCLHRRSRQLLVISPDRGKR